eukprot:COSAG05_NODE_14167_length_405_cov_5.656863_1_plen_67_part_10
MLTIIIVLSYIVIIILILLIIIIAAYCYYRQYHCYYLALKSRALWLCRATGRPDATAVASSGSSVFA